MESSIINSACFIQDKSDLSFYYNLFEKLKKEISFDFVALYLKKEGKYSIIQSFGDEIKEGYFHKLYFKNQEGNKIGYFLLNRKIPFKKEEKNSNIGDSFFSTIKDFEISKIFKNQLEILQEAIIEKTKLQKKLEEQNEKLTQTDKIRSEFLANVSHELRTPLNSIIGFSGGLLGGACGELNDKQKNWTNKILSSAIHLSGLINGILDMTKIEAGGMKLNLKEIIPDSLIKEVINTIEPLAFEKNIQIVSKLNFDKIFIGDEIKFKQIIYNILGNAVKFSHNNSKVIIKSSKKDNNLVIKIKDFGIGIEKKNHKKIFEKFIQLDNIYTKTVSSTGLGLTITNELVKMHNGEIKLKSIIEKGSEFTIILPIKT